MPLESETASSSAQTLGSLQSCLVEGDPEQRRRERRVRRKALFTSTVLQACILAGVILIPLFARPTRLIGTIVTPIPPYSRTSGDTQRVRATRSHVRGVCVTCVNAHPAPLNQNERIAPPEPIDDPGPEFGGSVPCPTCVPGGSEIPRPAPPTEPHRDKPPRIVTRLDPAMLVHRVEPVYPILPRQTHRSGRVELRAIIATDGSIQSLRVISGDPLFYQSAMEAVSQWRYRPTVLNGEPVEIDTFITVIYNIDHQ